MAYSHDFSIPSSDKCLLPYYGGCPYTRTCIASAIDVNCGVCLPGFFVNPSDSGGECLSKLFILASCNIFINMLQLLL